MGFDFSQFSILISKICILAIAYGPIKKFIVLRAVRIKQLLLKIICQCLVTVKIGERRGKICYIDYLSKPSWEAADSMYHMMYLCEVARFDGKSSASIDRW